MEEPGPKKLSGLNLRDALYNLNPNDHICLLSETHEEWIAAVVPFITAGCEKGDKVIYVADFSTLDDFISLFRKTEIDVKGCIEKGQLVFLHESDAYSIDGIFCPDRMIELIITEAEKARTEGYQVLRITGENTWSLRGYPGSERLLEYETRLNRELFEKYPCIAICQYDIARFEPEVIKGIVLTHPLLIKKGKLYQNTYYVETEDYLNHKRSEKEVKNWLTALETSRQTQESLKASEDKYYTLFNQMTTGVYLHDLKGRIKDVNPEACRQLGYKRRELLTMTIFDLLAKKEPSINLPHQEILERWNSWQPGERYSFEAEHQHKNGTVVPVLVSTGLTYQEGEKMLLATVQDITDRKQYEAELTRLSLHDQLTGLYNRHYFYSELERLEDSREYPIAIISADVDSLKLVNDTLGHLEGDWYLVTAAKLIKEVVRKSDLLARVGGDEFSVILPRTNQHTGEKLIARMRNNIKKHNLAVTKDGLPLSISLGLAVSLTSAQSLEETYRLADSFMYKEKLKNCTESREMIVKAIFDRKLELDDHLKDYDQEIESLCKKLGQLANLSPREVEDMLLMAKARNVGMITVPKNIINKPGKLTEDEMEIVRQHVERGYQIALASNELRSVAKLILHHHENWDGSGYPAGLKGNAIPVACRILAIVAAYKALLTEKPYRGAASHQEALEELKKMAGVFYDPVLTEKFIAVVT